MSLLNKDVVPKLLPCKRRRQVLKLWFLLAALSVIYIFIGSLPTQASTTSNIYYVAPNGNDNNPGTINKPWRHINYATTNNIVKPGDTIYVRGGTYPEYIPQQISGTQGNHITYRNYPGETPIITDAGDGRSWRWQIVDQSYLRIEGFTFRNYTKGALQIRATSAEASYIEVVNNIIEGQIVAGSDNAKAVEIATSDNNKAVHHILFQGNLLRDIDSGKAPVLQLSGNVYKTEIINNTLIKSTSIGINVAGRPTNGQPHDILIQGNEVSEHSSEAATAAGIYLDGAGENIVIEGNQVHDGVQGIKVDLEPEASSFTTKRILVRRNFLYNNSSFNLKVGVYGSEGDCDNIGKLQDSVIVHNVIYSDIPNNTNVYFGCGENLSWKNNIISFNSNSNNYFYRLLNPAVDPGSWQLDYNLFENAVGEDNWRWENKIHRTFADYQTASGKDQNSFEGNSLFIAPESSNFQIDRHSSAVDRGGALTFTLGAGQGNVVQVKNARYFSDGLGLQQGDLIRIGSNSPTRVISINFDTNTLILENQVTWQQNTAVNYDFTGSAPDIGAYEYVPKFSVGAIPQDGAVKLVWNVEEELPDNLEWFITYNMVGMQLNNVNNIHKEIREYLLENLQNYEVYEIKLIGKVGEKEIYSSTITAMPTDIFVYLPIVSD